MSEPSQNPSGTSSAIIANPVSGGATATAAPPKPALPPKPVAPKPAVKAVPRRFFLFALIGSWATIAWVTFSASMVGMLLGTVRFLFPNVLSEPPSSFKAGDINSFEENKVDDKFKDQGAWVIRASDERNRDMQIDFKKDTR